MNSFILFICRSQAIHITSHEHEFFETFELQTQNEFLVQTKKYQEEPRVWQFKHTKIHF